MHHPSIVPPPLPINPSHSSSSYNPPAPNPYGAAHGHSRNPSLPPQASEPFVRGHSHSASVSGGRKRVYAKDQTLAYSGGPPPSMMGGQPLAPFPQNGYPAAPAQQQPGLFSPAFPSQPQQDGAYGQQAPMVPQTAGPYAQGFGAQQQAAMGGLTNQFQNMNLAGQGGRFLGTQTINLIGAPPLPVEELEHDPPEVKLPAGASVSQDPKAIPPTSYQRCTLGAIPTNQQLLNKSKVPLALVCSPFRSNDSDYEPAIVTDTVIARCRRCRMYMNPYVTFVEGGNRWKCCMCNLTNEVPQMFDWDQENNQPADRWKRKELNNSVVEFVAGTEYMFRPPQPPTYLFLIDVSYNGVQSGMVATAARTILETLDRIPNVDNRTKICFIGVDSMLHFFSLTPGTSEPNMLVVGDLDDIFLPRYDDLLVNLTDARTVVETLLGKLGDMFKDNHVVGSAMSSAIAAAHKLSGGLGAKIMVFTATLPNLGPGALRPREDSKILGTAKESTLLQAQNPWYKTTATDCSRQQVSIDMWVFGSSYMDIATLSCLPRYTGGQVYFYPAFNAGRSEDALKFAHELGEVLASPIGLEAIIRIRASRGLRMTAFHGNFFIRSTDLLGLPAVPCDQSYTVEIQVEDPLTQPFVVFQTAVLHTSSFGERRIRVVTQAFPTTSNLSEIYSSVDQVALATYLSCKAVEKSLYSRLDDARDAVLNKLVEIFGTYKATMTASGNTASPALAIAENMKFLPLLCLGLLKHVGLRQSSHIPSDLRAYAQDLLVTLPTQLLIPFIHPTFYSLHNMPPECGTTDDNGTVILPPPLNLTSEKFERHGLFLIEDGQQMFLYLGRDAVPRLCQDVFGVEDYHRVQGGKATLPRLENPFSDRVNAIIGRVRSRRRGPYYPHLYIVKDDGEASLRMWALSCLIEDRQEQLPSYHQFLGQVKDRVNSGSF
ncbi:CPII coat sec24 protein [Atractiella rhizophila]|nr:CPII coat sec24 protein [Atractiella rhizophila]